MAASIESAQPLSRLVADLPQRFTASDRLQSFATEKSQQLIQRWSKTPQQGLKTLGLNHKKIIEQNETDGLRWTFDDQTIVHLRPSGNAPELRCYIEAESEHSAHILLNQILGKLVDLAA
jgi:phosphomannomutase